MHPALSSRHRTLNRQSGASLVPVLIIVTALAISALIFFTFTRKQMGRGEKQSAAADQTSQMTAGVPAGNVAPASHEPAAPSTPAPASAAPAGAATPQTTLGFARPLDLVTKLARALGSGDIKTASNLASAGNPGQAEESAVVLEKIFKDMGYKAGPDDKVELLGQVENFTRLSIPLIKPGDPGATLRLQIDLERDDKMGWKITKMHLPKELGGALASLPDMPASVPGISPTTSPDGKPAANPPPPTAGSTAAAMQKGKSLFVVAETTDALTFARDFVQALLTHDFVTAKKFIMEQKVPAQKLAGLCIVFEEGRYELKPAKPLIITVANPEVSWVIAQVESEVLQQSTEFGLELQRASPADEWRVAGLNLSEILSSFAQSASKLGVPYTPLVRNPKGGESLALYFEYDHAELHPRAQKQLEIVAGLLKSDTNRKLNIAGHTDAKGADDYNIRLSQSRAETVKKQLVALGVSEDQVITTAMGKAQPLGPNQKADGTDDPEGRSRNRRAEIFLDF